MLFQRLENPKTFGDFLPTLSTGKRRTARIMASRTVGIPRDDENSDQMEPSQRPQKTMVINHHYDIGDIMRLRIDKSDNHQLLNR
jgi:hypothetical protein